METKLCDNGQVMLPASILQQLGLQAGDQLEAKVEGERIVLARSTVFTGKARIIIDPVSGFPVLTLGPDGPKVTSKQVAELMAEFP